MTMTEDKDEKSKRILNKFEQELPRIWEQARTNEEKLKKKYIANLQLKLHLEIKERLSNPSYSSWIAGLRIGDIIDDSKIVLVTNSSHKRDWLETRYTQLIKTALEAITNINYEIDFVVFDNEGKNLDELFKSAFGEQELERQKELHRQRTLKPDFKEGQLNIIECVMCGCEDVTNVELDIPLKSNKKRLLSIRVNGAQCTNPDCLEQYYDSYTLDAIKDIEYWLNMREHHDRIIPFHLMSDEAREGTARVIREEDEDDEE